MSSYLSLSKYRTYRNSNDLRLHVMLELLELVVNKSSCNLDDLSCLLDEIDTFIRNKNICNYPYKNLELFLEEFGFSCDQELASRLGYSTDFDSDHVSKVVHILGAPRSGTSFLYYSLAYTGKYSYFTSDSHHIWSAFHLSNPVKTNFETKNNSILHADSKLMRLRHDLIYPSEAEHIWERGITCYDHVGIHSYNLFDGYEVDLGLLRRAVNDHCRVQGRNVFISKSPFNCFRIRCLEKAFFSKTYFIHIYREPRDCANSMIKNSFEYCSAKHGVMNSLESRSLFESKMVEVDSNNCFSVKYEDLVDNPKLMDDLQAWIDS